MKIGVSGNIGTYGSRIPELARTVEEIGFESIWTGEHIFVPKHMANRVRHGVPMPEGYKHMPDPFITLAMAAADTRRLKLGTSVCLVPQRHPLVLAKEVATLDRFSDGRFIFGVGNGWIEEEADILGFPFNRKVQITNECLRALKILWTEAEPAFAGDYVTFPAVYSYPKPVQKPHPPILIGSGDSSTDNSRILKRVAEIADGWMPINLSPAQAKREIAELKALCETNGRNFANMDITVLVPAASFGLDEVSAPIGGWRASGPAGELIAAYEDAGVTRLVVVLWDAPDASAFQRMVESAGKALGLTGE